MTQNACTYSESTWTHELEDSTKARLEFPTSTENCESTAVQDLVSTLLVSKGNRKQEIADEILQRIRISEDSAIQTAWTLYLILRSTKPGRVDDAIGLLSRLGPSIFVDAIMDAFMRRPPFSGDRTNPDDYRLSDDYWYVLIRSLGPMIQQGESSLWTLLDIAIRYPNPAIREAAVETLGEIDDERVVAKLEIVARDDTSVAVRRLAQEIIEELTA